MRGNAAGAPLATGSTSHGSFRAVLVTTLVFLFGLVTLGGVVRATESGLGCPDWPLCSGPAEASTYIELSHRIVAAIAALLVASVVALAWRHYRRQRWVFLPAVLSFVLIIAQAVLGGITVLTELPRWSVMSHLAMAQIVIAAVLVVYVASDPDSRRSTAEGVQDAPNLGRLAIAAALATFALLMAGSYVANTLGATHVCGDSWPLCRGQMLPLDDLSLVHMGHRIGAIVVGLMVGAVIVAAWRVRGAQHRVWALSCVAGVLFAAQVAAGGAHMWFDFAIAAQVIHLSLGTALWITLALLTLLTSGRVSQGSQGVEAWRPIGHGGVAGAD